MTVGKNQIRGIDFLNLGFYAFAGLGLEMVLAFIIEPMLYRKSINEFTTLDIILHWIITCVLWGIVALILINVSKKKYEFNIFANNDRIGKLNWLVALILMWIPIAINYWDRDGFKILKEFHNKGLLKFTFQYIYYFVEIILVVLIIIFGQKAGEIWFKNSKIPYGGIFVGLTWGLVHMFSKGDLLIGLVICFFGMIYGIVYLVVKKNIYIAYLLIFLMFVV